MKIPTRICAIATAALLVAGLAACAPIAPPPGSLQEPTAESICEELAASIRVETNYMLGGNVMVDDVAIPGAHVTVDGSGFTAETCTGTDGKWTVYVPAPSEYTVILDGQNLPKGITISDSGMDGRFTIVGGDVHQKVEWGLIDKRSANFFFRRDE